MVSTTQTLAQIKSQDLTGHIKQHFMTTSLLTYVTNGIQDFYKMLYQKLGALWPSTQQHALLLNYNLKHIIKFMKSQTQDFKTYIVNYFFLEVLGLLKKKRY